MKRAKNLYSHQVLSIVIGNITCPDKLTQDMSRNCGGDRWHSHKYWFMVLEWYREEDTWVYNIGVWKLLLNSLPLGDWIWGIGSSSGINHAHKRQSGFEDKLLASSRIAQYAMIYDCYLWITAHGRKCNSSWWGKSMYFIIWSRFIYIPHTPNITSQALVGFLWYWLYVIA